VPSAVVGSFSANVSDAAGTDVQVSGASGRLRPGAAIADTAGNFPLEARPNDRFVATYLNPTLARPGHEETVTAGSVFSSLDERPGLIAVIR
jgi:hypothetical protein